MFSNSMLAMVANNPLIRPAISWGKRGIGGVPLVSHDYKNSYCLELNSIISKIFGTIF